VVFMCPHLKCYLCGLIYPDHGGTVAQSQEISNWIGLDCWGSRGRRGLGEEVQNDPEALEEGGREEGENLAREASLCKQAAQHRASALPAQTNARSPLQHWRPKYESWPGGGSVNGTFNGCMRNASSSVTVCCLVHRSSAFSSKF
jgi:hypothetical protein